MLNSHFLYPVVYLAALLAFLRHSTMTGMNTVPSVMGFIINVDGVDVDSVVLSGRKQIPLACVSSCFIVEC